MDTSVIGLAAVITEAIASCTPDNELPFMAALLTTVGDQLALIAVCRDSQGSK